LPDETNATAVEFPGHSILTTEEVLTEEEDAHLLPETETGLAPISPVETSILLDEMNVIVVEHQDLEEVVEETEETEEMTEEIGAIGETVVMIGTIGAGDPEEHVVTIGTVPTNQTQIEIIIESE